MRQKALEDRGWRIHRVWSTDWFRNPERELRRVCDAISEAKTHQQINQSDGRSDSKDDSTFEREQSNLSGDISPDIAEYQMAELKVGMHGRELHAIPRSTMASWVCQVVQVESPVHINEVSRRIADTAGVGRIGARIQGAIMAAVLNACYSGKVRLEGDFLWQVGKNQPELRDRSNLPVSSRKLDLVAPEEIGIAVQRVVGASYGISRADVSGAAVRLLGFTRVTQDMRSRVDIIVGRMIDDGQLIEQADLLIVPGPGGFLC